MSKITINGGEQSCHIIKNEIHTTTNLYLPVRAERLVAMFKEAAAQETRKQISDKDNNLNQPSRSAMVIQISWQNGLAVCSAVQV